MADPSAPGNDLAPLLDQLRAIKQRLSELEKPTAGQLNSTSGYLASLKTVAATIASFNTGTVANDSVIHYFTNTPPLTVTVAIPTQRAIVTVAAGEASMTGNVVEAFASFVVKDSNGIVIPGYGLGVVTGRLYQAMNGTGARIGAGVSTPAKPIVIDTATYPGPYTITGNFGFWSASVNTTVNSCQFNDVSLVVEVIGA